jgi:3-dehydroquinate dehydratase-1
MICLSVGERTVAEYLRAIEGAECAEIRLDLFESTPDEAARIFAAHPNLIATCRPSVEEGRKKDLLLRAIEAGAAFVDVEVEWKDPARDEVVRTADKKGCRVIVSYHNYDETPSEADLASIVDLCFARGADIAKIACRVRVPGDNARLLGLLDDERKLIVTGMGREGRITRVAAPLCGSLIAYASRSAGKETAEGQLSASDLSRLLEEIRGV